VPVQDSPSAHPKCSNDDAGLASAIAMSRIRTRTVYRRMLFSLGMQSQAHSDIEIQSLAHGSPPPISYPEASDYRIDVVSNAQSLPVRSGPKVPSHGAMLLVGRFK